VRGKERKKERNEGKNENKCAAHAIGIRWKGGFCALDCYRNIIQFELSPFPRVKKTPTRFNRSSQDPDEYEDDYEFLVESLCGDLLMVHVFWNLQTTIKYKVYKLDWERMEWDEIKSLGEEAIFLCCDGSACIRADDSTIYKPNCIYDIFNEDFRVYDLGNETIGMFPHSFPCYSALYFRRFKTQL
jgi:hypothetical protein